MDKGPLISPNQKVILKKNLTLQKGNLIKLVRNTHEEENLKFITQQQSPNKRYAEGS